MGIMPFLYVGALPLDLPPGFHTSARILQPSNRGKILSLPFLGRFVPAALEIPSAATARKADLPSTGNRQQGIGAPILRVRPLRDSRPYQTLLREHAPPWLPAGS